MPLTLPDNLTVIKPSTASSSQPQQWDTRSVLGRISEIAKTDQDRASKLYSDFKYLQTDKSSMFYNPYSQATNSAVNELSKYGIDTSVIDDNFFKKNNYLLDYLNYNGQTNTPSSPMSSKKASSLEKAAYLYYQIWNSEADTKKAESQWNQLQNEIKYWAGRTDRNYSDDEILGKINWDNYKELTKMDDNKLFKPNEYNRSIGYSKDALYGVIWEARNPTYNGNLEGAMANSYLQTGNQWVANPEITARLNAGNLETYSPYSVGSTMEKEGLYFGVQSFDRKWIEDHRAEIMAGNDETAKTYFANVVKAVDYTEKLNKELDDMYTDISNLLMYYDKPEDILDIIKDSDDLYGDLFDLDKTLELGPSALKSTSSAVNYRWQDIESLVNELCNEKTRLINSSGLVPGVTDRPDASDAEKALNDYYAQNVESAVQTIRSQGTDVEKNAAMTGKASNFDEIEDELDNATVEPNKTTQDAVRMAIDELIGQKRTIYDYETHQSNRDKYQTQRDSFSGELEDLRRRKAETEAIGNLTTEQYDRLMHITDMPGWEDVFSELQMGKGDFLEDGTPRFLGYDRALSDFYRWVAMDDQVDEAKAEQWFEFLNKDRRNPIEKIVAEANQTGDDVDELEYDVPVGQNEWKVTLEKGEDGQFHFASAVNPATGDAYGADRLDEVEAAMGGKQYDFLTNEEANRLALLEANDAELAKKIDEENSYLELNESIYDDAKMDNQFLLDSYAAAAMVSNGEIDSSFLPSLDYAFSISQDYVPTNWTPYSYYDTAVSEGQMTKEEANKYASSQALLNANEVVALKSLLENIDSYGNILSDEEKKNIQRRIDALERDAKDCAYFLLDSMDDFEEKASAGEAMAEKSSDELTRYVTGKSPGVSLDAAFGSLGNPFGYGGNPNVMSTGKMADNAHAMTEEEKNRYYYLLATEGVDAAHNYFFSIADDTYGVITVRQSQKHQQEIHDFAAENGWNAALATVLSFGTNQLGGAAALLYEVSQGLAGEEVNPYNAAFGFQDVTENARSGSKEWLKTTFNDNKLVNMLYDAFVSHVDSANNAMLTSAAFEMIGGLLSGTKLVKFIEDIGFAKELTEQGAKLGDVGTAGKIGSWLGGKSLTGKAGNFIVRAAGDITHASSMGLNAASAAYRNVILKGGNQEQALGMFMATFWAETGSEAITFDNLYNSYMAGSGEDKKKLADIVKMWFQNGAEEFFGEGINEYVEQKADEIIMGAMSEHDAIVKEYTDLGYPESVAKQLANKELWKNILEAGAVGFISSTMGTATSYVGGRLSRSEDNTGTPVPGSKGMINAEDVPTSKQGRRTNNQQDEFSGKYRLDMSAEEAIKLRRGRQNGEDIAQDNNDDNNNPPPSGEAVVEEPVQIETDAVAKAQEERNQRYAKDIAILNQAYSGDATAATAGITSVLGTGDRNSDRAAAQAMVGTMAKGKQKVAVKSMQGIVNAIPSINRIEGYENVTPEVVKDMIGYAALTSGQGNQALQNIFDKVSNRRKVTAQDVIDVLNGVKSDYKADPNGTEYLNKVREYRVANYTIRNMARDDNRTKVEAAEAEAKQAKTNEANAQQTANDAHAEEEAVAGNLESVTKEYIPEDPKAPIVKENAGAVQQTRNELEGKMTAAQAADDALAIQKQKTQKTQENLKKTRQQVYSEARTEAEQTVAQEEVAEQQANAEKRAVYTPTVAVKKPVKIKLANGQTTEITGVYAVTDNEVIYTTPIGYIKGDFNNNLFNGHAAQSLLNAQDKWYETGKRKAKNPVNPAVWLRHSLPATVDSTGDTVTIVGVAGQQGSDTVLMDSKGKTYTYDDLTMQTDPFTGGDGDDALFDTLDNLDYDNLPDVSNIQALKGRGNDNPNAPLRKRVLSNAEFRVLQEDLSNPRRSKLTRYNGGEVMEVNMSGYSTVVFLSSTGNVEHVVRLAQVNDSTGAEWLDLKNDIVETLLANEKDGVNFGVQRKLLSGLQRAGLATVDSEQLPAKARGYGQRGRRAENDGSVRGGSGSDVSVQGGEGTEAPTDNGNDHGNDHGNDNIQRLSARAEEAAEKSKSPIEKYAKKIKRKLKSPQQIAHIFAKSLGIGDYIGSNNFGNEKSNTRGYFDRHAQLIAVRSKYAGQYTHTLHEAGHAVAKLLKLEGVNLANQQMIDNMIAESRDSSGYSAFESEYSPAERRGEAFAEFMWRYLEGEQRARNFAGDSFYENFERILAKDPGVAKAVSEARSQLQQWINATDNERFAAQVRHETTYEKQPLREAFRTIVNEIADSSSIAEEVNNFIRQNKGVNKLDFNDDLRAQSLLANHSQKRALQNLTDFLTDSNGTIVGDGLAKMLSDVGFEGTEKNIHLLEEYALLLHSLDRDKQNKPVFGDKPRAEREARIDEIEKINPKIKDAEAAWQTFRTNFLQEWMVNTGYWTQEFLDHLNKMYPHYVPTFRVKEEGTLLNAITGGGRGAKKFTLKAATGGSEDIYSPLYSFIGMVDQITSMVATNKVAQTFDRLYTENEGMGIFGRQIPGSAEKTNFSQKEGTMNARQKALGELLDGMITEDTMEKVLSIAAGNPGVKQNVANDGLLTVQREDGTTVKYQIDNPELYKLLTGAHGSTGIQALQVVGQLTRAMSMLTTGSNPLFAMRNAVRDFQNSVNYGSWANNYVSGLAKWAKAFYEVWRGSSDFDAYKALGGGGWTRIQQNNNKSMSEITEEMFMPNEGKTITSKLWNQYKQVSKEDNIGKTAKWAGQKLWNGITLARLNEIIEQTSRFAEYKYGKHDLSTSEGRQQAFLAAQEATVDFSRSGNSEAAYVLKKLIPFFNASMQGAYRTARQFTQAERGMNGETLGETAQNFVESRASKRVLKTVINTALMSALAAGLILRGDDDDKEEFIMLSDGVKANHLILPNPLSGQPDQPPFLRIPLAQDPLTYAVHNLVTNSMINGADDEAAISLAATADVILDNLNPFGSGTIAQPILDVSHNRTWYGSAIVRSNQADWNDPASQYNEDTPEIFRTLGRLANTSPEIVEYLASQYTGFLGAIGVPALSIDKNGNIGGFDAVMQSIVKKWTTDPLSSNDVTKSFYDMKKSLSTIVSEAKLDRPQGLLRRSLTQEQVNNAYEEADAMLKSGGIVYEASNAINNAYKEIDSITSNPSLTDEQKYKMTRDIKLDMLKQVQYANEALEGYYKKYITGETLTDRVFEGVRKRAEEGAYAHIKTPVEKMPDTFLNDSDSLYMQRVMEVYDGSGEGSQKSAALPHPSQSFTLTDRRGNEEEYTIDDDEWDYYTNVYKQAYEQYIVRKGARWDTMSSKDQYNLLKSAHTAANKAMKTAYAKDHRIQIK